MADEKCQDCDGKAEVVVEPVQVVTSVKTKRCPRCKLSPYKSDNEALAQLIEFLSGRLIHVYGESENIDYFHLSRKCVEHLRSTDGEA